MAIRISEAEWHGPDELVTDDLRSYRAAVHDLGFRIATSAVDGATTEPRTRINRTDDENPRCRASRARVQPKDFSQLTQRCHIVERRTQEFCVSNIFKRPRLRRAICSSPTREIRGGSLLK